MTQTNGLLTNRFQSTVAPYFSDYFSVETVNAYSGTVVNPLYGNYGAIVIEGGGHAASNDNSVFILDLQAGGATFRRVTDPTPLFGNGNDADTQFNNSSLSDQVKTLIDYTWCEYNIDGQPTSRHSYGAQEVIGPENGGSAQGTFVRAVTAFGAANGFANGEVAHMLSFDANGGMLKYRRAGSKTGVSGPPGTQGLSPRVAGPTWTAYVPEQGRIYIEANGQNSSLPPRWFDLSTQQHVDGLGIPRLNDPDYANGGIMFYVAWRKIIVNADVKNGKLRLLFMNVAVNQPSWDNRPRTLSKDIPLDVTWSAACWCPDSGRILVGNVLNDDNAIYEIEIPSDIDQTWAVTRVPLPDGQAIKWAPMATYKKWSYNPYLRAIVHYSYAAKRPDDDIVYVYRPRNT